MNNKHTHLSRKEAEELLNRYYDGLTSAEEETRLRQFLASEEADGGMFDADRAVMGMLLTRRQQQHAAGLPYFKIAGWAAAASIVIAIGLWPQPHQPECIAFIDGKQYTDQALILEKMRSTMNTITSIDNTVGMETQMKTIFNPQE